jgi:GT2 family glycosyltransferase
MPRLIGVARIAAAPRSGCRCGASATGRYISTVYPDSVFQRNVLVGVTARPMVLRCFEKFSMPEHITIVIITRNRCASLMRTLHRLTEELPSIPIIVVDNASTDGTDLSVSRRFPGVRVLRLEQNIGSAARNHGVRAAGTPYIAFCDDDSWWRADALSEAIAYFEAYPRVGLIAGKILVNQEQKMDPVSALQATSPLPRLMPMPGPAILGFLACGVFVRASAFLEAGGYNRKLGVGGEEQLLAIDLATAGWGLTYADDLVGYHHPSAERHPTRRLAHQARNRIWSAWLRRPWRVVLRVTCAEIKDGIRNVHIARGVAQAFLGLPSIIRQRRVPPAYIERQLLMLEQQPATRAVRMVDVDRESGHDASRNTTTRV